MLHLPVNAFFHFSSAPKKSSLECKKDASKLCTWHIGPGVFFSGWLASSWPLPCLLNKGWMEPGLEALMQSRGRDGWVDTAMCESGSLWVGMAFAAQRRMWPDRQRAGVGRGRFEARQQEQLRLLIKWPIAKRSDDVIMKSPGYPISHRYAATNQRTRTGWIILVGDSGVRLCRSQLGCPCLGGAHHVFPMPSLPSSTRTASKQASGTARHQAGLDSGSLNRDQP